MPEEPLPPDVTHVPKGYASLGDGSIGYAEQRRRDSGDVRMRCDRCPAYVDGSRESGVAWLASHLHYAHGVEP